MNMTTERHKHTKQKKNKKKRENKISWNKHSYSNMAKIWQKYDKN